jgi:hypothetical protein
MTTTSPASSTRLDDVKRIGSGLAFILFPLLFVFGFAVHPGLLNPRMLSDEEVILRAHHNALLGFGHLLVLLDAALLVVVALQLMKLLNRGSVAWAGFIGAGMAVLGAVMLAAEKGAECLTMSALDTLPEHVFTQMMPGLVAIFSHEGLMILVWGVVLIAPGFVIQAIGLFKTKAIPRWQSILLLIGICLLGGPDGFEIVNLGASILLTVALVPYGIRTIRLKTA